MADLATLLFVALWMVVGFAVLRFLGASYFREDRRASVFALCVVVAFTIGVFWPNAHRSIRTTTPDAASGDGAATVPADPATASSAAANVSRLCHAVALPRVVPAGTGYLDNVAELKNAQNHVARIAGALSLSETYVAEGWAVSATGPAKATCLLSDGAVVRSGISFMGDSRQDVAHATHDPANRTAGFRIVFSGSSIGVGQHRLDAVAIRADGTAVKLTNKWAVSVR